MSTRAILIAGSLLFYIIALGVFGLIGFAAFVSESNEELCIALLFVATCLFIVGIVMWALWSRRVRPMLEKRERDRLDLELGDLHTPPQHGIYSDRFGSISL